MTSPRKSAMVTGAAGFIGHHLVRRLLADGWIVAGIDDFSAGKRSYLEPHAGNSSFRLYEGDIRNADFVRTALHQFQPEVIFHLAAIHFIPLCNSDPANALSVNVVGTQTLVDNIPRETTRFIFASTGDVYVPSDKPHSESDPLGSLNIYGISKQMCEGLIAFAATRRPETRFTVLRLVNAYGPGETNPHVIPDILNGVRDGGNLRLGNLSPLRDYVFVADIVDAMLGAASYSGSESTINVGTGIGSTVRDVLDKLEQLLGRPLVVEQDPTRIRQVDRQKLVLNPSRAARELGWSARTTLSKGLELTAASKDSSKR